MFSFGKHIYPLFSEQLIAVDLLFHSASFLGQSSVEYTGKSYPSTCLWKYLFYVTTWIRDVNFETFQWLLFGVRLSVPCYSCVVFFKIWHLVITNSVQIKQSRGKLQNRIRANKDLFKKIEVGAGAIESHTSCVLFVVVGKNLKVSTQLGDYIWSNN